MATCAPSANIETQSHLGRAALISLGENSGIGVNCRIQGSVTIGRNVMMGPDVVILSQNHLHHVGTVPFAEQGYMTAQVTIGDNVWIGARSIILPGVTIGSDCVVGAGTVVSKSIPPGTRVVGAAARMTDLL